MSKSKIIFFDWNGTFIDDELETVQAFSDVLKGVHDPRWKLPIDQLRKLHQQTFEIPLSKMYASLGFSDQQMQKAKTDLFWKKKYFSLIDQIQMQPGVQEAIKLLKNKQIEFGILSNHTVSGISELLEKFGFSDILILANETDHQSHETGKLHRLEKFLTQNSDLEPIAIIGDSTEEVEIAKKMDLKSVILSNGWQDVGRIKKSNPDYLIHSQNLPEILEEIIG